MPDEEIEILKRVLLFGKLLFYSYDNEDWQKVISIQDSYFDEPGPIIWLYGKSAYVALFNCSLDQFIVASPL